MLSCKGRRPHAPRLLVGHGLQPARSTNALNVPRVRRTFAIFFSPPAVDTHQSIPQEPQPHLLFPAADPSPHRNRSHARKKRYRPGARLADAGGWCGGLLPPRAPVRAAPLSGKSTTVLCRKPAWRARKEKREAVCVPICFFYFFHPHYATQVPSAGMNRFDTIKRENKRKGSWAKHATRDRFSDY